MNSDPTSLSRLHDILLPPAAPWWPPAPAWYWVLGLAAVLAVAGLVRGFVWWQHNRYRREALAEFSRQVQALETPENRATALAELAALLKRVALCSFPREQVASLTGPAWFEFLDDTGRDTGFARGGGALLEQAVYDPQLAKALDQQKLREITSLIRGWIKYHHRTVEPPRTNTAKPC